MPLPQLKLHLGCGTNRLVGWFNVDLDSPDADFRQDLREPLPLPDACASHVFSEHMIEHMERAEGLALLRECHRLLDGDGVLRLSTPDLKVLARAYLEGRTDGWAPLWQPANPCRMMNEGMRSWGHLFMYDADELAAVLAEAGFTRMVGAAWRQSDDTALRGLECRPYRGELIVEARKR